MNGEIEEKQRSRYQEQMIYRQMLILVLPLLALSALTLVSVFLIPVPAADANPVNALKANLSMQFAKVCSGIMTVSLAILSTVLFVRRKSE